MGAISTQRSREGPFAFTPWLARGMVWPRDMCPGSSHCCTPGQAVHSWEVQDGDQELSREEIVIRDD